jgi:hypothetical protein
MNYTGIFDDPAGLVGYMMETFEPMQPYFWVLFFGGIIGYIYLATQSLTATIIAILLVLGIFGTTSLSGYFAEVPVFSQFLYIVTLVGLTALVGTFIMKKRF